MGKLWINTLQSGANRTDSSTSGPTGTKKSRTISMRKEETASERTGGINTQGQFGSEPQTKRKQLRLVLMKNSNETPTQKTSIEEKPKSTAPDMPALSSEGLSYSQLWSNRQQSANRVNQVVTDFENVLGGYGAKADNVADILAIKYGGTLDENGRQVFATQEGLDAFRKEYQTVVDRYNTYKQAQKELEYWDSACNSYDFDAAFEQLSKAEQAAKQEVLRWRGGAKWGSVYSEKEAVAKQQLEEIIRQRKELQEAKARREARVETERIAGLNADELRTQIAGYNSQIKALEGQKQLQVAGADLDGAVRTQKQIDELETQKTHLQRDLGRGEKMTKSIEDERYYASLPTKSDFQTYVKLGAERKHGGPLGDLPGNVVHLRREAGEATYLAMTEEEVAVYDYLLGKEGEERAQEYLNHIHEELNRRVGIQEAREIQEMDDGIQKTLRYGGYALKAGADNAVQGLIQAISDEERVTSKNQFGSQALAQELDHGDQVLYNALYAVGNMAPAALSSAVTGSPLAGAVILGASSSGNAYKQALEDGFLPGAARSYSVMVGASEAVLQYALGGISAVSGKLLPKALSRVTAIDDVFKTLSRSAVGGLASEVLEEEMQLFLEPMLKTLVLEVPYDVPNFDEVAETALTALLTTGMVNASGTAVGHGMESVKQTTGKAKEVLGEIKPQQIREMVNDALRMTGNHTQVSADAVQETEKAVSAVETAGNYDAEQAEAIRYEGKTFRNLVAGFDTKVSDFFSKWRGGRTNAGGEKLEKLYLGRISSEVKKQVSDILGYEVDKRDVIVTNDDVKHVFDHHGDADAELRKGNIPLEQWMFDALPEVISEPDQVIKGEIGTGKKNAGKQGVKFVKTFPNGKVVTVQFDNKGRKTLEITTLYAKNKGASSEPYASTNVDTSTVRPGRSEPAPVVNDTISPPANLVNSGEREQESEQSDVDQEQFVAGLTDGMTQEAKTSATAADFAKDLSTSGKSENVNVTGRMQENNQVDTAGTEENRETDRTGQDSVETDKRSVYNKKENDATSPVDYERFASLYREWVNEQADEENIRAAYKGLYQDEQERSANSETMDRVQFREMVRTLEQGADLIDEQLDEFFERVYGGTESTSVETGNIITDGSHIENGRLKPSIRYTAGENGYTYETNARGLIVKAVAEKLQLTIRKKRLAHNRNTYGKQAGDHAGHLFGDRFGGSSQLDNLVSQAKRVNLSEFKTLENQWAAALKQGKEVRVEIELNYEEGSERPISFVVTYSIDGKQFKHTIKN